MFVSVKGYIVFSRQLFVQTPFLSSKIHTTANRFDIMEFFDDSKNWGQNEVKHGRSMSLLDMNFSDKCISKLQSMDDR